MSNYPVNIALLGCTGSIGRQTLEVVRNYPDKFNVIGLASGQNLDLLKLQISEFLPDYYYYTIEENPRPELLNSWFLPMEDMASLPEVDIVVVATSGKAGLSPTLAAIKTGKKIALANKESLVMAGEIIMRESALTGASILPIDSEHCAIWQTMNGENQPPTKLILTASGGPFRSYSPEMLKEVTVEQALNHPSWQMGRKVTIDSATLMNKGLEIIEAHWLFNMPYDKIEVVIHPQSIVHSMVEYIDSSVIAQLSYPDMRLPIQYALSYPERLPGPQYKKLDWSSAGNLTFEPPDTDKFPCLALAVEAGRKGGTYPTVLCAADEVAVELFLSENIGFTDIARVVEKTLAAHESISHPTIEEILDADSWARKKAGMVFQRR